MRIEGTLAWHRRRKDSITHALDHRHDQKQKEMVAAIPVKANLAQQGTAALPDAPRGTRRYCPSLENTTGILCGSCRWPL